MEACWEPREFPKSIYIPLYTSPSNQPDVLLASRDTNSHVRDRKGRVVESPSLGMQSRADAQLISFNMFQLELLAFGSSRLGSQFSNPQSVAPSCCSHGEKGESGKGQKRQVFVQEMPKEDQL